MRSRTSASLLALIVIVLQAIAARAIAAEKPNIIYIIADDLGYGDVQCLNPERGMIATPHLDRLASQGMTFTDSHSGSAVCTPTRYGLLTGRYAWRTRLQQGVLDGGDDEPLIVSERLTVPQLLKQHGYTTACLGKWHLGYLSERPADAGSSPARGKKAKAAENTPPVGSKIVGGPTTRGFDLFWGCSNARTMKALVENDRVIESLEPVDMLPRLAARAVQYIDDRAADSRAGTPFFLYLPLTSPHTPIVPAPEWQGKSPLGSYADFVMQTDAVVGQVLTALDDAGLADSTLVVFTSDNGCSPAAKTNQLEQAGHFASAGFRGYKADIWEGGHRVPFFVRWPGRIAAGSRSDQLICHSDLMATCAELIGATLPPEAGEDSVSILPVLLGKATAPVHEAVVHHSISGRFAIRQGSWKLCLCAGSGGWSKGGDAESPQLYRLDTDPGEQHNVEAANPDVVMRLTKLLEDYRARGRSTPGPDRTNDVPIELFKP
ncbi:Arylsulfatase [Caulifigura coniformis]|uniref:Arylsulfatase n=1 Tax=Caulifigura coniformis TaxID=2527983 RepID=A0A517SD22_9PLAN|nr:arylsulfatase [Caulifigura coniformis]QDT54023.1 Arylsulfatase [Caulifigura coniformis]